MPRKLEKKLKDEARKKFPGDEEAQRSYVFGTMRNMGFLKKKKKEHKRDPDEHDYED